MTGHVTTVALIRKEGAREGGDGRGKGAADVAEKLRQVSQKHPESYRKHKGEASK